MELMTSREQALLDAWNHLVLWVDNERSSNESYDKQRWAALDLVLRNLNALDIIYGLNITTKSEPLPFCECKCGRQVRKRGNRYLAGHSGNRPKLTLHDVPPPIRDTKTGCLLFQGNINTSTGYGVVGQRLAHRLMYQRVKGEIPPGYHVDHVWTKGCRYRHCIEPEHLEAVSPTENTRRRDFAQPPIGLCKRGHELALWSTLRANGTRTSCRACRNKTERRLVTMEGCWAYVQLFEKFERRMPSYDEVGEGLGFSGGAVFRTIQKIIDQGALRKNGNTHRLEFVESRLSSGTRPHAEISA